MQWTNDPILIQRMHEDAKLPCYKHEGDSGMDLFALEETYLLPGQTKAIHTGLIMQLPDNTEGQIRPRSGMGLEGKLIITNSPGTIDNGYRGEVCIIMKNIDNAPYIIEKHQRIAQLVIAPVLKSTIVETDHLVATSRGANGLGSTGK